MAKAQKTEFAIESRPNPLSGLLPDIVLCSATRPKKEYWSLGKGWTQEERLLSAVGEVCERIEMTELPSDRVATCEEVPNPIVPNGIGFPVELEKVELEWVLARSLEEGHVVNVHRPTNGSWREKLYRHTSNGCAVGLNQEDAIARASGELFERHLFFEQLEKGCFNVSSVKLDSQPADTLRSLGWSAMNLEISDHASEGLSIAILKNESDPRFAKGGGVLGLSYGRQQSSHVSALSECLQVLETHLVGGTLTEDHAYFLFSKKGCCQILNLLERKSTGERFEPLGSIYAMVKKSDSEFDYYCEVYSANANCRDSFVRRNPGKRIPL